MSQTPEDYNKIEAFHHVAASNNPEDIIQNCHVALTAISNEFVKMLSNNKLLKQQLSKRDATIAELKALIEKLQKELQEYYDMTNPEMQP